MTALFGSTDSLLRVRNNVCCTNTCKYLEPQMNFFPAVRLFVRIFLTLRHNLVGILYLSGVRNDLAYSRDPLVGELDLQLGSAAGS